MFFNELQNLTKVSMIIMIFAFLSLADTIDMSKYYNNHNVFLVCSPWPGGACCWLGLGSGLARLGWLCLGCLAWLGWVWLAWLGWLCLGCLGWPGLGWVWLGCLGFWVHGPLGSGDGFSTRDPPGIHPVSTRDFCLLVWPAFFLAGLPGLAMAGLPCHGWLALENEKNG